MMCLIYFWGGTAMKKLCMDRPTSITLEEGYRLYLNDCRQRNLRKASRNQYSNSKIPEKLNLRRRFLVELCAPTEKACLLVSDL